ncbi:NAD-dependent dihydropyrimidine dehydrogenase PreA subunit [Clostridiales Family XIII bacterium PM5-7]
MIRKIIQINEEQCNGCGACAAACHEGAIGMVDGKAKLLRDDYCDGLGDCLPTCPTGAITFVEREAAAYDEAAVKANMAAAKAEKETEPETLPCGCPGSLSRELRSAENDQSCSCGCDSSATEDAPSRLRNWPVQIKLAPVNAPYFNGANLLIAADCTAYAYAGFHDAFMKNKVTLVGCPKLDSVDYAEKLTEIIAQNDIASISVIRMEVPCCGGLELAVNRAIADSGKRLPTQVVTISTEGDII